MGSIPKNGSKSLILSATSYNTCGSIFSLIIFYGLLPTCVAMQDISSRSFSPWFTFTTLVTHRPTFAYAFILYPFATREHSVHVQFHTAGFTIRECAHCR